MRKISIQDLRLQPFRILDQDWAMLVAGRSRPNPMTVSWGGFGTLWNKPVVTVYVRPTRFTFPLLDEGEFTLNFLSGDMRRALDVCGSVSGRDTDKWAAANMRPAPSERIQVPRVAEADLCFECRLLASVDMDRTRFSDPRIESHYPQQDYHRVFWGEVVAAWQAEPG